MSPCSGNTLSLPFVLTDIIDSFLEGLIPCLRLLLIDFPLGFFWKRPMPPLGTVLSAFSQEMVDFLSACPAVT